MKHTVVAVHPDGQSARRRQPRGRRPARVLRVAEQGPEEQRKHPDLRQPDVVGPVGDGVGRHAEGGSHDQGCGAVSAELHDQAVGQPAREGQACQDEQVVGRDRSDEGGQPSAEEVVEGRQGRQGLAERRPEQGVLAVAQTRATGAAAQPVVVDGLKRVTDSDRAELVACRMERSAAHGQGRDCRVPGEHQRLVAEKAEHAGGCHPCAEGSAGAQAIVVPIVAVGLALDGIGMGGAHLYAFQPGGVAGPGALALPTQIGPGIPASDHEQAGSQDAGRQPRHRLGSLHLSILERGSRERAPTTGRSRARLPGWMLPMLKRRSRLQVDDRPRPSARAGRG